ncbi:MAG: response regulator [Gammaproteobacteria bacterium]|nr:response regulator [Gammaproteobacteria bacterium]
MQRYKVLLVENQKIAQKIALFYLSEFGCQVDTAETGIDALELVKEKTYDLIFMDLGLDDIDGLTVTETIRKSEDEAHRVPIVALTAHDAEDIRSSCFEAGVDDFISKPFLPEKSRPVLEKYLRRN